MTDQTVPVPVDLLKKAEVYYREYPSAQSGPLASIFALIPSPPKVGDVLTADEVRQLPRDSVLIDADDAVWVRYGVEKVYLAEAGASNNRLPVSHFGPYTVIHLPDNA